MSVFGESEGHFRAIIEVYPCGSDTRKKPAFNGIRWAFAYAADMNELGAGTAPQSDVWPEFLDETGKSLANEVPLIGEYSAIMHIVSDHMVDVHFKRLEEGTKFFCMEGRRKVARGRVTGLSMI